MALRLALASLLLVVVAAAITLAYGVGGRVGFARGYEASARHSAVIDASESLAFSMALEDAGSLDAHRLLDAKIDAALVAAWQQGHERDLPWWYAKGFAVDLSCLLRKIATYRRAHPVAADPDLDVVRNEVLDAYAPLSAMRTPRDYGCSSPDSSSSSSSARGFGGASNPSRTSS